jgi:lysozyme family protein
MVVHHRLNPDDPQHVLWLQRALAKLRHGQISDFGVVGPLTVKALRMFQISHSLPVTGAPDELTLQKINQELQERGITI